MYHKIIVNDCDRKRYGSMGGTGYILERSLVLIKHIKMQPFLIQPSQYSTRHIFLGNNHFDQVIDHQLNNLKPF